MDDSEVIYSAALHRRAVVTSVVYAALAAAVTAALVFAVDLPRDGGVSAGEVLASLLLGAAAFVALYGVRTRTWRRRRRILSNLFPAEWERILETEVRYYARLSQPEKARFRRDLQIFLGEVRVTGIDTDVDDRCRVLVAASALIPVFALPDWEYRRLVEVLIYAGTFDEDYQVGSRMSHLLGMVPAQSSEVILAKPALVHAFESRGPAAHVGIHEFLHKVDGEDGLVDGVPRLLMDSEAIEGWRRLTETHIARIRGGGSDIDPYAGENPPEFFAVVGEYFFAVPVSFGRRHPDLYQAFARIVGQDPAGRIRREGMAPEPGRFV